MSDVKTTEVCPFCSSELLADLSDRGYGVVKEWKCGNVRVKKFNGGAEYYDRSWDCRDRQIEKMQSRILRLEAKCHQQQCEIADLRKELERATAGL